MTTRLARIMQERGLSQLRLRVLTGLARQTITEAFHGRSVSLETKLKIAEALDVPPNELWPETAEVLARVVVG